MASASTTGVIGLRISGTARSTMGGVGSRVGRASAGHGAFAASSHRAAAAGTTQSLVRCSGVSTTRALSGVGSGGTGPASLVKNLHGFASNFIAARGSGMKQGLGPRQFVAAAASAGGDDDDAPLTASEIAALEKEAAILAASWASELSKQRWEDMEVVEGEDGAYEGKQTKDGKKGKQTSDGKTKAKPKDKSLKAALSNNDYSDDDSDDFEENVYDYDADDVEEGYEDRRGSGVVDAADDDENDADADNLTKGTCCLSQIIDSLFDATYGVRLRKSYHYNKCNRVRLPVRPDYSDCLLIQVAGRLTLFWQNATAKRRRRKTRREWGTIPDAVRVLGISQIPPTVFPYEGRITSAHTRPAKGALPLPIRD